MSELREVRDAKDRRILVGGALIEGRRGAYVEVAPTDGGSSDRPIVTLWLDRDQMGELVTALIRTSCRTSGEDLVEMPVQSGRVTCAICRRPVAVNSDGSLRPHGPIGGRCRGRSTLFDAEPAA